jgi:hypothetical protein
MPPDPNLQKVPIGGTLRDHICTPEGRVFVIRHNELLLVRIENRSRDLAIRRCSLPREGDLSAID